MSLYRRAAKRDSNERPIFQALQACGCAILPLSRKGAPDAVVFGPRGQTWLVEVKAKRGKLTEDQIKWRETWGGPEPIIIRDVDEALALVKQRKGT